jgi:MFS family permease
MTGPIAVSVAFVIELTLVPFLLPAIQEEFALSVVQLAWVFNFYGVAVAVGVLSSGWLGDLFETESVFAVGVSLFAAGSMFAGLSDSYGELIAARTIQGFGAGFFSPLVPILLTRVAPTRPGKVLIVWGSLTGYTASMAPLIYGNILDGQQWRLAFFGFSMISVIALALLFLSPRARRAPRTIKTTLNLAALLQSRDLWKVYGYIFATYGSITYYLFNLPLWLAGIDYSSELIAVTLSAMWLSFSVMSTVLRNLVDQPHVRSIVLAAPILISAGFALIFLRDDPASVLFATVLIGASLACSNSPSTQLVLGFAPEGMSSTAASLDITFARLGGVVSVAILAASDFGYAVLAIFMMSGFAYLVALFATRNHILKQFQTEGADA